MFLLAQTMNAPEAVAALGLAAVVIVAIGGPMAAFVGLRKAKIAAGQEDELRQLVRRYEHLAETILDAQQRVAADMADVRSRTASVEQILRSVE